MTQARAMRTWFEETLEALEQNRWTAPLYLVGGNGEDVTRQTAVLSMLQALQNNTSTRTLLFQNAVLDNQLQDVLVKTLQQNQSLVNVTLRNLTIHRGNEAAAENHNANENHRAAQPNFYALPAALFASPTLRSVSLTCCRLDRVACQALAHALCSNHHSLDRLYLNHVALDHASVVWDALRRTKTLRSLTKRDMPGDMHSLWHCLAHNSSLESLSMERLSDVSPSQPSNDEQQPPSFNHQLAHNIAYLFQHSTTLRNLSLRENCLTAAALEHICGQANNCHLQSLYLSHNPLGPTGARVLMGWLRSTCISDICLALTGLGPEGCQTVARHLPNCPRLRRLNLDGNQMEDCGPAFATALQTSYNVVSLFDYLPKLIDKGLSPQLAVWEQVHLLLRANRCQRRFFSQIDNRNEEALVPHVLAQASSDPDVLFSFVQGLGRPLTTTNQMTMTAGVLPHGFSSSGQKSHVVQQQKPRPRVAPSA